MPNKNFRFHTRLSVVLVLLGALWARQLPAQTLKDSKGRPLQVGVQLYSVRAECEKDLPGTLKALAAMGYRGVEFAGYYRRSAKEIRALLDANRLKAYGTHLGLDALLGDKLDKTIEYAKVIGCKFLCVPWLPENRRNTKQATIETAHLFVEIAKKVNANGMTLGWHNEDYEFKPVDGETIWDTFTANSDKSVALQFDTGNALSAGEQAAPYLLKYPQRTVSVHLKDHSKTNPNALLGEGDEHWNEVIPILKTKTATRWYIVEQESYGQPPLVCVEKCLRNFEKLWTQGSL